MNEYSNEITYEYYNYPKRFIPYRWYKPLFVFLLGLVFTFIIQIVVLVLTIIWKGDMSLLLSILETLTFDSVEAYSGPGALMTMGTIAAILPGMALATLVVRDRPFSSYSTSRGGWNWGGFFKCLGTGAVIYGAFGLITYLIAPPQGGNGPILFTLSGFLVITLICPVQCVAEEYLCRGFLFQTFGSWIGKPLIAIAIQAVIFMFLHTYNIYGMLSILIMGVLMGIITWKTRGLEAAGALHIVNNLYAFYWIGFGLQIGETEGTWIDLVLAIVQDLIYVWIVLKVGTKRGWFKAKGDGTVRFNEKIRAKQEAAGQNNDQTL